MKEKQQQLIKEFLAPFDESYCDFFNELAEYAVSLGYNPVKCKTQTVKVDFVNPKSKAKIMKFDSNDYSCNESENCENKIPGLRLKFYAAQKYSERFQNAVKRVIENYGGKYTGCYGCGRCDGTRGYTYTYPDGKQIYRCGSELISVYDLTYDDIHEIKSLLKAQADFYMSL